MGFHLTGRRRVKALAKKTEIEKVPLDINDAVRESQSA